MNRRTDSRIEMKLPCQLLFPEVWPSSVTGITANLHRNGVLVACDLSTIYRELPAVGDKANIKIVLPYNQAFSPKCIECESVLVRVSETHTGQWQFALRIENVNFTDFFADRTPLLDLDAESCRYVV